jgi:hypothetical protein
MHTPLRSAGRRFQHAGLVLALVSAACTSDFTEINDNPNAPTDVDAQFLITHATVDAVRNVAGSWDKTLLGMWAQHTSQIEYAWNDRYEVRAETPNNQWKDFYAGALEDYRVIFEKAKAASQPNHQAVAMIMRSWLFQNATDAWGDIPYTDALRGETDGNTAPKYDTQEAVYDGVLAELKQAATLINTTRPGFGTADAIYNGDMVKWRKFANSLRLRMAMRLSEVAPAKAQAGVQSALADGVFTSAADEAIMPWVNSREQYNQHPWWSGALEAPGGSRIAATLVDTLKSLADPRLPIYARPNDKGEYVGMQNGLRDGHGIAFPARSMIGERFVRKLEQPSVIFSYAEVLFIRAEAAVRGWAAGDPAQLYHDGVRAAMKFHGISDADIAAYLAQPAAKYDAARGRQQIGLQKWIAFFTQGPEAYAEWRRTGYPNLRAGPDVVTNGVIARRVEYPTDEQSLNNENLQEAVARQGGAGLTSRVWWDKRP